MKYFWFIGVLLAKVLQDNRLVDLPLSKQLLRLLSLSTQESTDRVPRTRSSDQDSDLLVSSLISDLSDKELEFDPPKPSSLIDKEEKEKLVFKFK